MPRVSMLEAVGTAGAPAPGRLTTTFRLDGGVTYRELGTPRLKGLKQRQLLYEVVAAAGAADASSARNPAWTSPPS